MYLEFLILACTIYILASKLYDEEDDDIIFFFSPEYGYAEDEEDCDEDNNL